MAQVGQTATIEASDVDGSLPERCLAFRAGGMLAALRLEDVIETMRPLDVHPLAGTQPFVRGVTILRGRPAPVIDMALLLSGAAAPITRYIAVRTPRGPVALATGDVLGLRNPVQGTVQQNITLLGAAPVRLVRAVGSLDDEPLFLLQSLALVPDALWAAVGDDDGPEPA